MSQPRGILPELAARLTVLEQLAAKAGLAFVYDQEFGGVRSEADTARAMRYRKDDYAVYLRNFAKAHPGRTPLSIYAFRPINAFGGSYHNFGAAVDVDMVTGHGTLEQLGALAPVAGLTWGGTFVHPNSDPRHFQLPISLLDAKARWLKMGNVPGVARVAGVAAALLAAVLLGGFAYLARA